MKSSLRQVRERENTEQRCVEQEKVRSRERECVGEVRESGGKPADERGSHERVPPKLFFWPGLIWLCIP